MKPIRNQSAGTEIHPTVDRTKDRHSNNYPIYPDKVEAQAGEASKRVHYLAQEIVSLPKPFGIWAKFFAEFAKECFDPSRDVPKKKERVENDDINVEAPPQVVDSLFNRDVQNNSDVDEEKEVLGINAQSKITNSKKKSGFVDINNKQYPEANFATDRYGEVRTSSMNINISF